MTTVITDFKEIEKMMDSTTNQKKRKELENFLKVCVGNPSLLFSICSINAIDGHSLDPESCAPIADGLLQKAMNRCVERILSGCEVNGKDGHFSSGGMGSRWLDLNEWAESQNLTYCRCAFYSKKFSKDWDEDKPYSIVLTVEKAK